MKIKSKILILLSLSILFLSCSPGAENLGVFAPSRLDHVDGQDGVTPVVFTDTHTMWTFGDTIMGEKMIPNSLAFSPKLNEDNVRHPDFTYYRENGKIVPFIRYKKGEDPHKVRLWALDGVKLGNTMYVYYLEMKVLEEGNPFGFAMEGIGLARWDIPGGWEVGDRVDFKRLKNLFPRGYPAFGACVMHRDGYVYTIGQFARKDLTSPVKIARVPDDRIADPGAYTFLRKDGEWVDHIEKASPFLNDVAGECSLSYNEYFGQYMIVYCQTFNGKITVVRFNDFSMLDGAGKTVVYTAPKLKSDDPNKPGWYYSGKEIYSHEDSLYSLYIHPLKYQPILLKVSL